MSIKPNSIERMTATGDLTGGPAELLWLSIANTATSGLATSLYDASTPTSGARMTFQVPALDTLFESYGGGYVWNNKVHIGSIGTGLIITGAFVSV